MSLRVVVSPYHLTTREPPAMAALLLGEVAVTLVPAPFEAADPRGARRAAAKSPRYLEFVKSWEWTVPLWRGGVLASEWSGDDAAADMREIARRIGEEDRYAPLRTLMKGELFQSERAYLDALGADVLKGGPDPGITVPLAAGLDRFAARHGMMVARAAPASVAQRAEAKLARNVFAIALPVLLQASAERLLLARDLLGDELAALREAIDAIANADAREINAASDQLARAVAAYAHAFDQAEEELTRANEDEVRVVIGPAVLTGVMMPYDAVLRSSLDAITTMSSRRRGTRGAAAGAPNASKGSTLPTFVAGGDHGAVTSLIVRAMGVQPRGRRG